MVYVVLGQWVASPTDSYGFALSPVVLGLRHWFEMRRHPARTISTEVVDMQPIGDRPDIGFVGKPVNRIPNAVDRDASVAVLLVPGPHSAAVDQVGIHQQFGSDIHLYNSSFRGKE